MKNGFVIKDSMLNNKTYDGNTFKYGITVNNEDYIIKRGKEDIPSLYSEHIASRFIRGLGFNSHETWLGYDKQGLVVIMKDFCVNGLKLRSYESTKQSHIDLDYTIPEYTYADTLNLISNTTKLDSVNKQKAITQFWDMFICDAILGNRDRHHGNWGYLSAGTIYQPAPIYDNGASLFPNISTKINNYKSIIGKDEEYNFIDERSEKFPASVFKMERPDGTIKKTNYYEMLGNLQIDETLSKEVKSLRERIGFNQVYNLTSEILSEVQDIIPPEYRRFYLIIICVRYLHIIERKSIKESYSLTLAKLNGN